MDLVFSNFDTDVMLAEETLSKIDDFPPVLEFLIPLNKSPNYRPDKIVYSNVDYMNYNFKNVDYDLVNQKLANIDWEAELAIFDTLQADDRFYKMLNEIIKENVLKKRTKSDNFPTWFSKKLKTLIVEKKIAHKDFKKSGSENDYNKFSKLRCDTKMEIEKCFSSYFADVKKSILDNPKYFWKYVIDKNNNSKFPRCMFLDDK